MLAIQISVSVNLFIASQVDCFLTADALFIPQLKVMACPFFSLCGWPCSSQGL
jgi:hypothetical protein